MWSFGILLCELIGGKLPYADTDDPMRIQQQTLAGEIKLPRDIDQHTRDLIQCILIVEPDLRISLKDLPKKPYFKDFDFEKIRHRKIDESKIPFKPSPHKFKYVL